MRILNYIQNTLVAITFLCYGASMVSWVLGYPKSTVMDLAWYGCLPGLLGYFINSWMKKNVKAKDKDPE